MNYFRGAELEEYENWMDRHLRPTMIQALQLPVGKLVESVGVIERGLALVNYFKMAKEAEKQINTL